ncbi:hypothetical protein PTTG_28578 [Puccinia triticina 1-1 BBBD Race 1]|uniref:Protein kinase domain-containing protein n=1 Tax=Puccinia triticina (isolate 1-1 / race 1 (BBBD)) TaxID=630390 RepID=A0A180GAP0_PUCT1|nr:hypothetical protein PTTG_28578 [Puccinia triticina 1-1 BBBD Race 1]
MHLATALTRSPRTPTTTWMPPLEFVEEGDQVVRYIAGQIIGRGGFSVVRKARHPVTEQRVAVYVVQRAPSPGYAQQNLPSISSRDHSSLVAMTIIGHLINSTHLPLPTSVTEGLANALLKQEIWVWSNLTVSSPTPRDAHPDSTVCADVQRRRHAQAEPARAYKLYRLFAWPS